MRTYHTPLDLVRSRHLENPVVCKRPDELAKASRWFQENFPGDVFYAVKANPSPWVIQGLVASGIEDFEVASLAEIEQVVEHCAHARIAFMHPVKSRFAIREAYFRHGVRIFALDCIAELQKILEETDQATDLILVVRQAVSSEHALFSLDGKFGAAETEAAALLRLCRTHARELGISFHIGSQCMDPIAYRDAMAATSRLVARAGVTIDIVDVGGGFPCRYPGMTPPPMAAFMSAIRDAFAAMMVTDTTQLWCEPGRALVAEAESLIARVDLRRQQTLYINDGSYGALFDAAHADWRFPVRLLRDDAAANEGGFQIYGPTCDSIDMMSGDYWLPDDIREGDYIEIGLIGAYGTALATPFNGYGVYDEAFVGDAPFETIFGDVQPDEMRTAL